MCVFFTITCPPVKFSADDRPWTPRRTARLGTFKPFRVASLGLAEPRAQNPGRIPFAEMNRFLSVGFKGNLSLLESSLIFPRRL